MKNRQIKDLLYEQVALVGKAVASPKRLELLDLLGQCEKTVETLADNAGISVKLASAHLKALRLAHLVATRKDGKYVVYRLADKTVSEFWVQLRSLAEERLVNAQMAVQQFLSGPDTLAGYDRRAILEKASHDEIIVIDVRPQQEFQAGASALCPLVTAGRIEKTARVSAQGQGHCCLLPGSLLPHVQGRGRVTAAQRLSRVPPGRWCRRMAIGRIAVGSGEIKRNRTIHRGVKR